MGQQINKDRREGRQAQDYFGADIGFKADANKLLREQSAALTTGQLGPSQAEKEARRAGTHDETIRATQAATKNLVGPEGPTLDQFKQITDSTAEATAKTTHAANLRDADAAKEEAWRIQGMLQDSKANVDAIAKDVVEGVSLGKLEFDKANTSEKKEDLDPQSFAAQVAPYILAALGGG